MAQDLKSQLMLNAELLGHLELESRQLRQPDAPPPTASVEARREMLPRLEEALSRIREHRGYWLSLNPEVRAGRTEIRELLRRNQDLIMRLIVLDRENEQLLLRQGLIPPKHLPPVNRQRPHYVADLYRRSHAPGGASPPTGDPGGGASTTARPG